MKTYPSLPLGALLAALLAALPACTSAPPTTPQEAVQDRVEPVTDQVFAESHFERGLMLERTGRPQEALAAYADVVRLDPNYEDLYYNRGVCYSELQNWEAAVTEYDLAIEKDPSFSWAHTNRAEALIKLRRLDEARVSCAKAISLDAGDTLAHQLLGVVYLNTGESEAALASFRVCMEREPLSASHAFNAALALEDLGRLEEALRGYQEAVLIDPSHGGAESARDTLLERLGR